MTDHLTPGFGPLDLELLDENEQRDVRAHLDSCEQCAAEYRLSAEALASFALSLPRTMPSPNVRARVLKSLSVTNRFEMFAAQVAELIDVSIDKARELVGRIDDAKSWATTYVPGVFSYDLAVGPAVADAVVGFVKITPGYVFPDHEHMGEEANLILQGSADDGSGKVIRRGALVLMSPGTHHELRARPGPDLIYLGIAHKGFLMGGQHIKPGDPRG